MRRHLWPVVVLVMLLATVAGCGSPQQTAPEKEKAPTSQPRETANVSWPEWSGPQSLGPGGTLPETWRVDFAHYPKSGSAHCYKIGIDSEGTWSDTNVDKGKITEEELSAVKSALDKVNWELVPKFSDKDYVSYMITPKSYPFPSDENPYFEIMVWPGQVFNTPPHDRRTIVADLKAPCPPEVKEIINVLKALQEKYEPQLH